MTPIASPSAPPALRRFRSPVTALLALVVGAGAMASCSSQPEPMDGMTPRDVRPLQADPPSPDPRVGLAAGLFDAEEAIWNLRKVSSTPPAEEFVGVTNSDLAFKDQYAIQGNYNGVQVWDISNPASPRLVTGYVCPASQSDVSVYEDLLFVSGEGLGGRLDCGTEGVQQAVSQDRLRGIRIFDISDIRNPRYISNVQTCRGSHTHTVLKDPDDDDNVYIYVSGSAPVRPEEELAGCSGAMPEDDPNSALFRIEVIRVPLASPEDAAIVSSPRIFEDLVAPPEHGLAPADLAVLEEARARGAFIVEFGSQAQALPDQFARRMLDSIVVARGGSGAPTAADSAALRDYLPEWVASVVGSQDGANRGPTQCHDITVYPAIDRAGGACEGYGLLLDISDPANPRRLSAVSDSNFAYWHSATFNNDGTTVVFTDEWGGGGGPKCRDSDPMEWGANAIFSVRGTQMDFRSYYKMPAAQTPEENCVAHNGSLIPIPGRDVMVQGWYQGGISIFDFTDPANPVEIAYHDRGPVNADRMVSGGSWSVYWYNGVIVNSEIARGLDIFELVPNDLLSQNEIEAARSVRLDYLNSQGQPQFVWPNTFALARSYVDQLERSGAASAQWIQEVRRALSDAEGNMGATRDLALRDLAEKVAAHADQSADPGRVHLLEGAVRGLIRG
ncbi:MAG TPA: hypothetical protein VK858_08400 [Longimicrobiales bacterium]|nr:hypothetical protein [Longimicrobiales bacterium]